MKPFKYKFKTKPDQHQVEALKHAIVHRKYGIFFQQRVGKTKVAIDFCGVMKQAEDLKKVIIVSPLSVREEWGTQIDEHLSLDLDYNFYLYPDNKNKCKELIQDNLDPEDLTFIAINYDKLRNEVPNLKDWEPDILIFDESHLIKNHSSKRSKASYRLSKGVDNVLLLTGTPIPKNWYDIFAQFRTMNASIFGHRWPDFKRKYCIMGGYMGKEIVGCTDSDYIADTMGEHSIRVLRKDVFDEPKVEHITIPVTLEPKAYKTYKELKQTFVAELDLGTSITADMAGVRLMRLQQLCGGFIKNDEDEIINISNAKLKTLVDLVTTQTEGNEPVVIFHRYRAEGDAIVEKLRSKKLKVAEFNGSVSEDDRKIARNKFQKGELDAIVIQISTGAMGITLDRSHINIFYSLDFSLSNYLQARDRVMGRNQKNDVTNYYLAASKTVDYKVIKTLQKDEDIASAIADKWRWFMDEEE
jgi:SNF2 family DNA or RNA helicase